MVVVTCFRCGCVYSFSLVLLVGGGLQRRHPDVLVVTQLMAVPPHRADGHVEVYVAASCCWLSARCLPHVLVVTQLMADSPHRADGHVEVDVAASCCWLSWRLYVCLWLLPPLRADVLFSNSEWRCL